MSVTFIAPASGVVFVYANVLVTLVTATFEVDVDLKDAGGHIEGTQTMFVRTNASVFISRVVYMRARAGLTPGNSYTWKFGSKLVAGAGRFDLQNGMEMYVMG